MSRQFKPGQLKSALLYDITASYALNAITASYAATASYVANASSFPYTGNAQITGSLGISGSLGVTGGITGSLLGTASYAITVLTASYVNPLTQNVVITGSLLVSGSTSQILMPIGSATTAYSFINQPTTGFRLVDDGSLQFMLSGLSKLSI